MPQTAYNLLIDIGNTFVKWGRYRAGTAGSAAENCLDSGHLLRAEVPELAAAWRRLRSSRVASSSKLRPRSAASAA